VNTDEEVLDTETFKLGCQPLAHFVHLGTIRSISRDTGDGYGCGKSFNEWFLKKVDTIYRSDI
jgi:hypothetical protein